MTYIKRQRRDKRNLSVRDEVLGKEFDTNNCGKCVVVNYVNKNNVTVEFYEPRCVITCRLAELRKGRVKNPKYPLVYGIACVGQGRYSAKTDYRAYKIWSDMVCRCYNKKKAKDRPTYKDVEVCKEWLDFQNFAKWCYEQKGFTSTDNSGKVFAIDKDILVKGNKIYSPETCCFVPREINNLLLSRQNHRGEQALGVHKAYNSLKYTSAVSVGDRGKYLGSFDTEFEAFQAYKDAKESYIKELAEKWKGKIDDKVYQSLINYEVKFYQ